MPQGTQLHFAFHRFLWYLISLNTFLPIFYFALAFSALAHIGDAPEPAADAAKAAIAHSRHYSVRSEAGTNSARQATAVLETLRSDFIETFRGTLRMHASTTRHRAALVGGRKLPHPGLYDPRKRLAMVDLERNRWPSGQLTSTLRHEGAHQLVDQMLRIPVMAGAQGNHFWVREGLACYFEGSGRYRLNGTVRLMRLGTLEAAYRDRVLPPVAQLVSNPGRPGGPSGSSVDYALAWSFVHFLMHGERGTHRDRFLAYLGNLQQWNVHGRGREAFAASFPEPESLHAGWVKHVAELQRGNEASFTKMFAPVGRGVHHPPDKAARDFIPKLEPGVARPPMPAAIRERYANLSQLPDPPREEALATFFTEPNCLPELAAGFGRVDAVRQQLVLDIIAEAKARQAVPFLIETSLRHGDPRVRKRAAELVRDFHYGIAPKAYFDLMRGRGPAAMQRVAEALETIGDPHAIKYLVAILSQVGQRVGKAAHPGTRSAGDGGMRRTGGSTRVFSPRTRSLESSLPETILGRNEAEAAMAQATMKALRSLSGENAGDHPRQWMAWLPGWLRRLSQP